MKTVWTYFWIKPYFYSTYRKNTFIFSNQLQKVHSSLDLQLSLLYSIFSCCICSSTAILQVLKRCYSKFLTFPNVNFFSFLDASMLNNILEMIFVKFYVHYDKMQEKTEFYKHCNSLLGYMNIINDFSDNWFSFWF